MSVLLISCLYKNWCSFLRTSAPISWGGRHTLCPSTAQKMKQSAKVPNDLMVATAYKLIFDI